jgi:hypothetical protein
MSDSMTGPETGAFDAGPFGAEARTPVEPEPQADAGPVAEPEDDPAAPAPLHVPRTPTGNAEADAQLDRLADVDHLATDGHVEVYEDVHRGLRDALTALDARPGPPAPPAPYSSSNHSYSISNDSNSNRS